MRTIENKFILASLLLLLTSCGPTYYANNRAGANFQLDSAQCEAYANGMSPDPAMMPYDSGSAFSGSGVVGSTPYFYSGTVAPNAAYNMQAGLNNAGASLQALGNRIQLYELCLKRLGWYEVPKPENKKITLEDAANHGNVDAQLALARHYYKEETYSESIPWLEKAAQAGSPIAQGMLGELYLKGLGTSKDYVRAKKFLEKSAKQGIPYAQTLLGLMYKDGVGTERNIAVSKELFEQAANKDEPVAQFWLGTFYMSENAGKPNYLFAKELFEKSSSKGNTGAMAALATLYYRGLGVAKDYDKAFRLLTEAASKGDEIAMNQIGYAYLEGKGTPKNLEKAQENLNAAIAKGFIPAIDSLGEVYERGFNNVTKALEFYDEACKKGVQEGCANFKRLSNKIKK